MSDSTRDTRPAKPYAGFPLYPHATHRWCKKHRGRTFYFGSSWDDWEEALQEFEFKWPYITAGKPIPETREATPDPEILTLRALCGEFLLATEERVATGEVSQRHFSQLKATCKLLLAKLRSETLVASITPADFRRIKKSYAETLGPTALQNALSRVRRVFNWGVKEKLILSPVAFGDSFHVVASQKRKERNGKKRFIEAESIRAIYDIANPPMQAMILLAINAGLGNADCGRLQRRNIDFDRSLLEYPRGKTGVARLAPLWDETIAALLNAEKRMTRTKGYRYFFITKQKNPWFNDSDGDCPISQEFRKLADRAGVYRPGVTFYALRHSFRTVADEVMDREAVRLIMGHADDESNMDHRYIESISVRRLEAVSNHVHDWLYPAEGE